MAADHLGMTLDGGPVHDLTMGIDDADRGLLHGDIKADVVLLAHGGLRDWIEAPLCRRFRCARHPEYPI